MTKRRSKSLNFFFSFKLIHGNLIILIYSVVHELSQIPVSDYLLFFLFVIKKTLL